VATAILCSHGDKVFCAALQLARVLYDDDSIGGLGDFPEKRVGKRRLARRRAAGDKDVLAFGDSDAQHCRLIH
jgi:hypothetical protein